MKITEERLDELQRRFEGYCGRTVSEGNAVTVNYPKWIEVLELVRGYRIGLATEAAPVVPVICKCGIGKPMAYVNLPLEFTGKRVRIVPELE